MKWIEALQIWNQGKAKWCIPKKDSAEYGEVRAIMEGKRVPKQKNSKKAPGVDVSNIVEGKRRKK